MEKPIRWGIIGLGRIAEKFATDLATVPSATLHAVAANNSLQRAAAFAQKHQAAHYYGSYEDLLTNNPPDVVYIATPHTSHATATLLCLQHGVGVLCEKPFAMNAEQVKTMITLAEEKRVFLMEALWSRFLPAIQQVEAWVQEGQIGIIRTLQADFGFKAIFDPEKRLYNPALGGGALLDIGIYPAFLALLLLGYPTDIQAVTNLAATGVDETTSFVLGYPAATAVLNCTIAATTNCTATIYGTEGKIEMASRFHETREVSLHRTNEPPIVKFFERSTFGYNFEIEEVNRCLRNNQTQSSAWPLQSSYQLISLLDAIRAKAGIHYTT